MRKRRLLLLVLLALPLTALPACQKDEKIESYDVKQPDRQKLRLLAAILPHGERTWFVRLSGPEAEVAKQKPAFDAFVKSIRFDDKATPPIHWTVPDGWTEQGGDATTIGGLVFRIKGEPEPLLAKLSSLGKFGEGENTLSGNVSRWRKQLSLGPASEAEVERLVQRQGEAFVVDITGTGVVHKAAPMPMEHPQVAAGPARSLPFRYEVPRGWEPSGGGQFSSLGYEIREGPARARVTITALQGNGGGVLFNLKRWRQDPGQAALPPIADADILKQAQTLPIAGVQATYADYSGKDVRILGVILPLREKTWFIKMIGPPDLVGRQKASFEAFVQSFRLDTE